MLERIQEFNYCKSYTFIMWNFTSLFIIFQFDFHEFGSLTVQNLVSEC